MSVLKRYTGTEWEELGGGGTTIPYQDEAPTSPAAGSLWIDSDDSAAQGSLLVAETVVSGSAVTSVTFSGLDGNAAGGYVLHSNYQKVTDGEIRILCNDHATSAYYTLGTQVTYTGLVIPWANLNNATCGFTVNTGIATLVSSVDIVVDKVFLTTQNYSTNTSNTGLMYNVTTRGTTTITNITTVKIECVAGTFGIGSTFRLYRRK